MMRKKRGIFLAAVFSALVFLSGLPVFADAVAPGPLEMLKYRLEEYLPAVLITIGVLAVVTAVILIVVLRTRKKKRLEQEKK